MDGQENDPVFMRELSSLPIVCAEEINVHKKGRPITPQKAELAAQYNQWKDVIVLWNTAQSKGLYPVYGAEYLPFIRAYLRTQNYLEAQALIEAANRITSSQAMRQTLCRSWLEAEIMEPAIKSEVTELLKCQP